MNAILKGCSFFDIFSVTYSPSLVPNRNKSTYQSAFGGLISLGIYAFILFYSTTLLMAWFNNEMVMKVSNQQELTTYYDDVFLNSNSSQSFSFSIYWNEFDQIFDPFNKNGVILLPLLYNAWTGEVKNMLHFYNETEWALEVHLPDAEINHGEFFFIFLSCIGNEDLLDIGQYCSTQELSDNFWKMTSLSLIVSHSKNIIDIYTQEVKTLYTHTTFFLSKSQGFLSILNYKYSYTEIKSGFLFQETNQFLLKESFQEIISQTSNEFIANYISGFYGVPKFQNTMYGAILLSGWSTVNHTVAQYPTISEILASIGSVLQTILLIKYIIMLINRRQMVQDFKDVLTKMYFPDIKQITKIGKGKQKQYIFQKYKVESQSYKQFQKYINDKFDEKLNYVNLIYEISKMQVVLQQLTTKEKIIKSHMKSTLHFEPDSKGDCQKLLKEAKISKDQSESLIDFCFDPFIFNYSEGQIYSEQLQKNGKIEQFTSLQIQQQPELLLVSPEIQVEYQNIRSDEGSMRPQQSRSD